MVQDINNKDWGPAIEHMEVVYSTIIKAAGGINRYNYRHFGEYDTGYLSKYLNTDEVKTLLNVPTGVQFVDLNTTIN